LIAILDYVLLPIIELGEGACADGSTQTGHPGIQNPDRVDLLCPAGKIVESIHANRLSIRRGLFRLFCRRWNVMLIPYFWERFMTQWWWSFTILLSVLFCVCVICLVSFFV